MNKLIPIINDFFSCCNQLGQDKETYDDYKKMSQILSRHETYIGVGPNDVKEAVWHASSLEWKITDNFYDGYKWKTTHYLYLLRDLCGQGFSRSIRQAFEEHPEKFDAYRSVEVGQTLLSHNNALSNLDEKKRLNEWTDLSFVKKCLKQGTPHTLALFSDGILFDPDITDMVVGEILGHGTQEDKEKMLYQLGEAHFYDCTPWNPLCVSDEEKKWGVVVAKWLPKAGDCCGVLLAASARLTGDEIDYPVKAGLGKFYKLCFQGLTRENVQTWDFTRHEVNECMDFMVEFLPKDVQDFFIQHPSMHGFPFCGAQALKKQVSEEVAKQLREANKTSRKF